MQCTECDEEKQSSEFYKNSRKCKECVRKREAGYYHEDIEVSRAAENLRYQTDPKAAKRRALKAMKRYEV